MKKSVKSRSKLHEMALAAGATITDKSGKQFNTSKKQAVRQKRLEPVEHKPKAEPKPAPAPPVKEVADKGSIMVAEAIEAAAKSHAAILAELKQQISQIQLQSAHPPIGWDFEFIRDGKEYLERVRATAIFPDKKSLN